MPELGNGLLFGGTGLSLYCGHRVSIDLDIFTTEPFKETELIEALVTEFGDSFEYEQTHNVTALFSFISDIKVDVVHYPHPLLQQPTAQDGLRLISMQDIAAMKVNAVLGRGQKKDFYDICELLNHYSLQDMFHFYQTKYPSQMLLVSLPQALVYFDDADESEDPISLNGTSWDDVKAKLRSEVRKFLA